MCVLNNCILRSLPTLIARGDTAVYGVLLLDLLLRFN